MNPLKGRHPGQFRAEAQEAGGNHLAGVPGDREPAEEAGKCSTVPSPILICVSVFQFAAIVSGNMFISRKSRSEMGLLNSLQENIDRTIEAMDHVIAFYNVSKEVEPTVAQVRG